MKKNFYNRIKRLFFFRTCILLLLCTTGCCPTITAMENQPHTHPPDISRAPLPIQKPSEQLQTLQEKTFEATMILTFVPTNSVLSHIVKQHPDTVHLVLDFPNTRRIAMIKKIQAQIKKITSGSTQLLIPSKNAQDFFFNNLYSLEQELKQKYPDYIYPEEVLAVRTEHIEGLVTFTVYLLEIINFLFPGEFLELQDGMLTALTSFSPQTALKVLQTQNKRLLEPPIFKNYLDSLIKLFQGLPNLKSISLLGWNLTFWDSLVITGSCPNLEKIIINEEYECTEGFASNMKTIGKQRCNFTIAYSIQDEGCNDPRQTE